MKAQQFLDSINIISSTFEMQATKLLKKNKPISQKIQMITMNLLSFKTSILKCFNKIFKDSLNQNLINQIDKKLKLQINQNQQKVKKYQIHTLIKRKIHKIHQQSMMNSISMDAHEPSFQEDPVLSKLRNSLILIQKDLGINQEIDNYHTGVNSIIHKSMASLNNTPIRSNKLQNNSVISDLSLDISIPQNNDGQENENKNNIQNFIKKQQRKQYNQKPPNPKNLGKKKKKSVYSSKQKVLGNLLQQTYQSFLQNTQQK